MFEDVLQHADKEAEGEDVNKEEEVEKDESNSSETENEDKTDSDTAEKEDKQEPVSVTLNEDALDQSEMCEESDETPEASSSTDKEELQSVDDEGEMKEEKESGTMGDEDFLTLPPSCILSPFSKYVEDVVTPLVLVWFFENLIVHMVTSSELCCQWNPTACHKYFHQNAF